MKLFEIQSKEGIRVTLPIGSFIVSETISGDTLVAMVAFDDPGYIVDEPYESVLRRLKVATGEKSEKNDLCDMIYSSVLSFMAHPDYTGEENDEWTDLVERGVALLKKHGEREAFSQLYSRVGL